MASIVVLKNSKRALMLGVLFVAILFSVIQSHGAMAQAGTSINAVICNGGSTVTLNQPVSDSTVVEPVVTIAGKVTQASQVEVYVNGQLDGIISIPSGQTTFSGTTTLATGTSTVKVVAVDFCQLQNGEASSVVTFNPPPDSSGSTGSTTDTSLPDQGVVIGGDYEVTNEPVVESPFFSIVPPSVVDFFRSVGDWLNITTIDESSEVAQLTILRALTIAVGTWLLAFGLAATILQWAASSVTMFQGIPKHRRPFVIGVGARIVGFLLLVLGLFL